MARSRLTLILTALFVGLPLLDVVLLTFLGGKLGFWPTVGLVLLSGFAGVGLAKSQGLSVWRSITRDMAEGRPPAQGVIDAVLILVAGGMLMAPGFITDVLGLSLLLPAVRAPIKTLVRREVERRFLRLAP